MKSIRDMLGANRIVPVVKINDAGQATDLASALTDAGITVIEVTFRTDAAAEAIRRCRDVAGLAVGAGTVRTREQIDQAVDSGAEFLVSPGFNPAIVEYAQKKGIPHVPGTITPGEVEQASDMGLTVLKFFPAEQAGGTKFLKALGSVYPEVGFMPTGGIGAGNIREYLALANVIACGGSWIVDPGWIAEGRFDQVRAASREAVTLTA